MLGDDGGMASANGAPMASCLDVVTLGCVSFCPAFLDPCHFLQALFFILPAILGAT